MDWKANVIVSGTIASVGARLLNGTAERLTGQFFDTLKQKLQTSEASSEVAEADNQTSETSSEVTEADNQTSEASSGVAEADGQTSGTSSEVTDADSH